MENNEPKKDVKATGKRAYSTPELKSFGDAVEITRGTAIKGGDGGGTHSRQ